MPLGQWQFTLTHAAWQFTVTHDFPTFEDFNPIDDLEAAESAFEHFVEEVLPTLI